MPILCGILCSYKHSLLTGLSTTTIQNLICMEQRTESEDFLSLTIDGNITVFQQTSLLCAVCCRQLLHSCSASEKALRYRQKYQSRTLQRSSQSRTCVSAKYLLRGATLSLLPPTFEEVSRKRELISYNDPSRLPKAIKKFMLSFKLSRLLDNR